MTKRCGTCRHFGDRGLSFGVCRWAPTEARPIWDKADRHQANATLIDPAMGDDCQAWASKSTGMIEGLK